MTNKPKPVHEIRFGAIKASIWENQTESGVRHNVTLSRLYRDGDSWKRSEAVGRDDLPLVVKVADLAVNDRSAIMTDVAKAGAVAFGAPTMNNQMFPAMADVLTYVKGLRPQNKIGLAFGSFGWSGESPKNLNAILQEMKVEIVCEPIRSRYAPTPEVLKQCYDMGVKVGEKIRK